MRTVLGEDIPIEELIGRWWLFAEGLVDGSPEMVALSARCPDEVRMARENRGEWFGRRPTEASPGIAVVRHSELGGWWFMGTIKNEPRIRGPLRSLPSSEGCPGST